jgi:hypothetical protein
MISGFKLNSTRGAQTKNELLMAALCRKGANDPVIWMAAYDNLPGFVGQNFQTEYFSRKTT